MWVPSVARNKEFFCSSFDGQVSFPLYMLEYASRSIVQFLKRGWAQHRSDGMHPAPRKSFQKVLWVPRDGKLATTAYDGSLLLHRLGFRLFDYQSID